MILFLFSVEADVVLLDRFPPRFDPTSTADSPVPLAVPAPDHAAFGVSDYVGVASEGGLYLFT